MNRYILDSGPAQDCVFRRNGIWEKVVDVRRRGDKIGLGLTTLGEILGGIELSGSREESHKITLRNLGLFVLWPFDRDAAKQYVKYMLYCVGRADQCNTLICS